MYIVHSNTTETVSVYHTIVRVGYPREGEFRGKICSFVDGAQPHALAVSYDYHNEKTSRDRSGHLRIHRERRSMEPSASEIKEGKKKNGKYKYAQLNGGWNVRDIGSDPTDSGSLQQRLGRCTSIYGHTRACRAKKANTNCCYTCCYFYPRNSFSTTCYVHLSKQNVGGLQLLESLRRLKRLLSHCCFNLISRIIINRGSQSIKYLFFPR